MATNKTHYSRVIHTAITSATSNNTDATDKKNSVTTMHTTNAQGHMQDNVS